MYTVAILPWLMLEEPLIVDEFELVPVNDLSLPDLNTQAVVSRVLDMHLVSKLNRAERATILKYIDRPIEVELSSEETDRLYDFVELLAFSGISKRELFGQGNRYCARDNFRLSILTLPTLDTGFRHSTRRRDTPPIVGSNSPTYHKPRHVFLNRVFLDVPLLESLVHSWCDPTPTWWPQVFESIISYNIANTDNSAIPEYFEIISLVSAFQRLLDTGSHQPKLRDAFSHLLTPSIEIDMGSCLSRRLSESQYKDRVLEGKYGATVREVWLHDMCCLRGNVAHGKLESPYQPLWSQRNHLLLASYVFPLLLKRFLASHDAYGLSSDDQFDIDVFESQAFEEHFDEANKRHPWNEVRRKFYLKQCFPWLDENELN